MQHLGNGPVAVNQPLENAGDQYLRGALKAALCTVAATTALSLSSVCSIHFLLAFLRGALGLRFLGSTRLPMLNLSLDFLSFQMQLQITGMTVFKFKHLASSLNPRP